MKSASVRPEAVEQTVDLVMIWDAKMQISLHNDNSIRYMLMKYSHIPYGCQILKEDCWTDGSWR